jgi:hypothetical protein
MNITKNTLSLGTNINLVVNTNNVERKNCSKGYIPILVKCLKIPLERGLENFL